VLLLFLSIVLLGVFTARRSYMARLLVTRVSVTTLLCFDWLHRNWDGCARLVLNTRMNMLNMLLIRVHDSSPVPFNLVRENLVLEHAFAVHRAYSIGAAASGPV